MTAVHISSALEKYSNPDAALNTTKQCDILGCGYIFLRG